MQDEKSEDCTMQPKDEDCTMHPKGEDCTTQPKGGMPHVTYMMKGKSKSNSRLVELRKTLMAQVKQGIITEKRMDELLSAAVRTDPNAKDILLEAEKLLCSNAKSK